LARQQRRAGRHNDHVAGGGGRRTRPAAPAAADGVTTTTTTTAARPRLVDHVPRGGGPPHARALADGEQRRWRRGHPPTVSTLWLLRSARVSSCTR